MANEKQEQEIKNSLLPFDQIVSPTATLREKNHFTDKSFVDIEYEIPEGLDEETCKVVVLGALMDEEICSTLKTSSSGAETVGIAPMARTFFFENVFRPEGDEREQDFGRGIKEGRIKAAEALKKFKEDPSLVAKYIENAVKATSANLSNPFRTFSSETLTRSAICEMVLNTTNKDSVKQHLNLDKDDISKLNTIAKTKAIYAEVLANEKVDPAKDKATFVKAQLTKKLLYSYAMKIEKDYSDARMKSIEAEEVQKAYQKYPDLAKKVEKEGIDPASATINDLYKISPNNIIEFQLSYGMRGAEVNAEYEKDFKDSYALINSFGSSREMADRLSELVTTSKAYPELMELPPEKILQSLQTGEHQNVFGIVARTKEVDRDHEDFMPILEGNVNSKRLVEPLQNIRSDFKKTEGVLHGASDEYKAMISDLFNVISDSKEIGKTPSKTETLRNLEKMEKLSKSAMAYIQHKKDEPDSGSIGTRRLSIAENLKTYIDKEIENQKKRIDFNFENRINNKTLSDVQRNMQKKNKIIEEQLEGFYNFTSPKVTLREENNFTDKSFKDIEYEIPEGMDKDTCCLITLGAMLDEETCASMGTSSTGANVVGRANHSRTMILDNIFDKKGDSREEEYGKGFKIARENAKKAMADFKENPAKACEYIQNVINYTYGQSSTLFNSMDQKSVRYMILEEKALNLLNKEPFKSGVEITPETKEKVECYVKGIDTYVGVSADYSISEIEKNKEQFINQKLVKQLLERYADKGDQEELDIIKKNIVARCKDKLFRDHLDFKQEMIASNLDPETIDWNEMYTIYGNRDYVDEADSERADLENKEILKLEGQQKSSDKLVSMFNSGEEFAAAVTELVSKSKYANELMKKSGKELKEGFTPPGGDFLFLLSRDTVEAGRLFSTFRGHVNYMHLVDPLKSSIEEFKKTEGFFHGHHEQYANMLSSINEFVEETEKLGKSPTLADSKKHLEKMEKVMKAVDDYISYKEPLQDTGSTGTKRLSEAKKLRTLLTNSYEDQKNAFAFHDKKNVHMQKDSLKKELMGKEDRFGKTEKVKEKVALKDLEKY